MPLLSKEIQEFYISHKIFITLCVEQIDAYEKKFTTLYYQHLAENKKIQSLTQHKLELTHKLQTDKNQRNELQRRLHLLLIKCELLLESKQYEEFSQNKIKSIRFRSPEDKESYFQLITQYEGLKKEYETAKKDVLSTETILNTLIDIREKIHFSSKFQIFSLHKKKLLKLGLIKDIEYFEKSFLGKNHPAYNFLRQFKKCKIEDQKWLVSIKSMDDEIQKTIHHMQEQENIIKHQIEDTLQEQKNNVRKCWVKLIEQGIKNNTIETNNIIGTEDLQLKLKYFFTSMLGKKQNINLAKQIFLEWCQAHPLILENLKCFSAFSTMKNILTEKEIYKNVPLKIQFILLKEAYFQLFYQNEKYIGLLVNQYKIEHMNSGLRYLLKNFINTAHVEITLDINDLIRRLIEKLELSLLLSEKDLMIHLPQQMGVTQKNISQISTLFKKIVLVSTPIIQNHLIKVFENKIIPDLSLYLTNHLTPSDFKHAATIIAKQTLYHRVLNEHVLKYIGKEIHIKGKTMGGRTQTLNKIAVLNDFLAHAKNKIKKVAQEQLVVELNKLTEQLNIPLSQETAEKILSHNFPESCLFSFESKKNSLTQNKLSHATPLKIATESFVDETTSSTFTHPSFFPMTQEETSINSISTTVISDNVSTLSHDGHSDDLKSNDSFFLSDFKDSLFKIENPMNPLTKHSTAVPVMNENKNKTRKTPPNRKPPPPPPRSFSKNNSSIT